jgi:hypothetical protein
MHISYNTAQHFQTFGDIYILNITTGIKITVCIERKPHNTRYHCSSRGVSCTRGIGKGVRLSTQTSLPLVHTVHMAGCNIRVPEVAPVQNLLVPK